MSAREEPSYLMAARNAVSYNESSSATVVRELVARIDRDTSALKASQPRTITTIEELDALHTDSLIEASGSYPNDGGFTNCWVRPLPSFIGGSNPRAWEVLIYLDGGPHNLTTSDRITLPAIVLHEPVTS
ncbi:MAG: hypothetical protein M3536_00025 [Actinomycetota bacterium]|nr:hypothetical protein [Actinomycetota bacterium]